MWKVKARRTDCVSNYIMDDSLDIIGEEMEADVSQSLKKVASYTLIVVLLCS